MATLNEGQEKARAQILDWLKGNDKVMSLSGPAGCHEKGALLLMADGSIKQVEEVQVGDRLMGLNGPREVLALGRGHGEMVKVQPVKGEPFVVNRDHILTLQRSYGTGPELVDVSVRDWEGWQSERRKQYKLFRVPVEFEEADLPLSSYFLGLLVGDGSLTNSVGVSKPDVEVLQVVQEQADHFDLHVYTAGEGTSVTHHLNGEHGQVNPLRNLLRELKLFGCSSEDKFLPTIYKHSSRQQRLDLLAGYLDADGHLTCGGYDFITASSRLFQDVLYVARSLGLAAYGNQQWKECQTGAGGWYWRGSISGDCSVLPLRIPRKKASKRRQTKSVLRTGFSIERLPDDDYYGFVLDGDGRYLLADFTVTHNTGKTFLMKHVLPDFTRAGDVKLTATTGKAALRLAELTEMPTTTLHKVLYEYPDESDSNKPVFSRVNPAPGGVILVVDEASMITPDIWKDLQGWTKEGVKILFVGDGFQLPPVMDASKEEDFNIFELVSGSRLTQVMRNGDAVLDAATKLRLEGVLDRSDRGSYRWKRAKLAEVLGDWLKDPEDHAVVTWRNRVRMIANRVIRKAKGFESQFAMAGEPVLIRRNSRGFLNGQIVTAVEDSKGGPKLGPVQTSWLKVQDELGSKRILFGCAQGREEPMDGVMPALTREEWAWYFREKGMFEKEWKQKQKLEHMPRMDPVPITYGYVLTAHAAQGSEFDRVTVYLEEWDTNSGPFNKPSLLPDGSRVPFWVRWVYTAITRSKKSVEVVIGT